MVRPEIFFRNNTASTLSLLEAMLAAGPKRLVFSSTAAVYGEPESVPIQEDARLAPTNPYGESKLLVEQMLAWFNRIHGLRYASLRYFNVAGAHEGSAGITRGEAHEPETHLIPLVLDVALGRRASIRIYGDDYPTPDGTCIRDYIHVSDLAEAHLLGARCPQFWSKWVRRPKIRLRSSTTWVTVRVSACETSSSRRAASLATPFRRRFIPAVPAIRLSWSPAPKKPSANWAGSRATPRSTRSSARRGSGTRSATRVGFAETKMGAPGPSHLGTGDRTKAEEKRPMQRIYLLSTGGTIEKVYSEQSGAVENRAAKLDRYLRALRLPDADIRTIHLMNKDSLEMTDADRVEVRDRVGELIKEGAPIVISHGTDTMVETGLFLEAAFPGLKIQIILTGAMTPLGFEGSDGLQNLTESLLAARLLSPGVFVVMHGQVFPVSKTRKDKDKATFVWK